MKQEQPAFLLDARYDTTRLLVMALIVAVFAWPLAPRVSAAKAAERPNIIFLFADDQRLDTMGIYGNDIIHTPNLDKLGSQGVIFDNAFVTTAICATNRACVYTGQYASRHGVLSFRKALSPQQLANTYMGKLKEAGYFVGYIGKWGVAGPPKGLFDYNKAWPGQNKFYHKVKTADGKTVTRHLTAMMGDQSLEFLERAKQALTANGKPFSLTFSFKAPHVYDPDKKFMFQYDPKLKHLYQGVTIPPPKLSDPAFFNALPEALRKSENRSRWNQRFSTPEKYQKNVKDYYRLISGIDVQVGRLRKKLEELGLADNTVIIYSSDHGFYLGERGFAGKWYAHELSIRVPLLIFDPRQQGTPNDKPFNLRIKPQALSIDLAPTMLDLAGIQPPKGMQGVSLLPLLKGDTPKGWRSEFYYEHNLGIRTIPKSEGVRTPRWKYAVYHELKPVYEELYDMHADPDEGNNLAKDAKFAKQLDVMRAKHKAWKAKVK